MSEDASRIIPASQVDALKAQQAAQAKAMGRYAIMQEVSKAGFTEWSELSAFNPLAMAREFRTLEHRLQRKGKEEEAQKTEKEEKIQEVQSAEETSEQYERNNQELKSRDLLRLKARIRQDDNAEQILKKVLEEFSDFSLADEALDFLLETSEGELAENIKKAKEEFNVRYGREIRAGRNIGVNARTYGAQGVDTPSNLRDLYRDITGNPREAPTLFEELSQKYTYDKMKPLIDFLLHSLGSDLKAKGPSIARAELHRLMTDIRVLQAILGIYRYFKSRMRLIRGSFSRSGLFLTPSLSFEGLAKLFMKYLQDRYPSADKVLNLAALLNLDEELVGQIIIFTQMRDATRQVAPRLFKSEKHRQDVLLSFMQAIEELDEQLEEEEEKEEETKEEEEREE